MENTTKYLYIARLIARFADGKLSDEELTELENWKNSTPENTRLFERIIHKENRLSNHQQMQSVDVRSAWKATQKELRPLRYRRIQKFLRYAAIILLFITSAAFVYYILNENNRLLEKQRSESIGPGGPKATLILSEGEKYDLEDEKNVVVEDQGGIIVENKNFALNYNDSTVIKAPAKKLYHTIEVPRGGEYRVVLSDGSVIHLNSMTTLKYPVKLDENIREVELLKGEAFFEVARNESSPFVIKTKEARLNVLGTSFNVSAYEDDSEALITLETGSLEVQNLNNVNDKVVLKPDQQAVITIGDLGPMAVNEVDATIYSSWRYGTFVFKNEPLEKIMQSLARWYEIEIFFEDESLKQIQFSANVSRYSNIEPILELLQITKKIKIETDNKYVLISK